jgi:hypothetical protein
VDEVLPFVVQQANALALHVYDPQAGVLYRPDGQVCGDSEPPRRTPATERDVRAALCAALAPFMRREGFAPLSGERGKGGFQRAFPGGMHAIELKVAGRPGDVRVGANFTSRNDSLQAEVDSVLATPPDQERYALAGTFATLLGQAHPGEVQPILTWFGAQIRLRFLDEVDSIATTLEQYLRNDLFPLLRNAESKDSYWALAVDERCRGKSVPLRTDVFCQMLAGVAVGDHEWETVANTEIARVRASCIELEPFHSADSAAMLELRRQEHDLLCFKSYLLRRADEPERRA